MDVLHYNPGSLPVKPAPSQGEAIEFEVNGWPPWKDISASIRNRNHRDHSAFLRLRNAANAAMNGRAWYSGPVGLDVTIFGPEEDLKRSLTDYFGGIEDTIDGSHGYTFTFLPICFEDDAQVRQGRTEYKANPEARYAVRVEWH